MNNKTKTIILIVLLSFLAIFLISVTVKLIKKPTFLKFNFGMSKNLVIDEMYDLNFEKISIYAETANIYIKNNIENNIKVKIYNEKETASVTKENNELNIKLEAEKCIGFCFEYKTSKIEIYLPSNFEKNILINNSYGNIKIEDFNLSNIDIKTDSGNIEISSVKNANIESSYGNINIDNILNKAEIKEDCGNIKIDNLNIKENSNITNSYGNIKINKTNDIYIDAKTDLGNVKVNNSNHKSDITLTIINDCGNVKVN